MQAIDEGECPEVLFELDMQISVEKGLIIDEQ